MFHFLFPEKLMSRRVVVLIIAALAVSFSSGVYGQAGQTFQFVVSALDDKGEPLTDLKAEEVVFAEKAGKGTVSKVEPFALPVKVTIAVDNGSDFDSKGKAVQTSALALPNYRNGLKGFVEAFPPNTEMTLITTSPQPRMVVKPTTDRAVILRGVNGFAPEEDRPRFTDALVEYSQRLQKEIKDGKTPLYVPIMLMVSTAANESSSYQPPEVQKALEFLISRRVKLYVTVNSTRSGDATATADLNTNRQAIIAVPATKALNGRFEAIAIFNRLDTLLPEMGQELASYAKRLGTQHMVTVQRAAAGPMEELRIELTRPGAKGSVSVDGYFPR
jgi:hypothetical protein